jgi:hypothetical protein
VEFSLVRLLAGMMTFFLVFALFLLSSCSTGQKKKPATGYVVPTEKVLPHPSAFYKTTGDIPLPAGFKRTQEPPGTFGEYLRKLPLKKDKTVYLWNGERKKNQSAQFAVIDIPTGNKDLQQCADVVMRLRAEYLFDAERYNEILFNDFAGKKYAWTGGSDRQNFYRYLENVFGWCGSASLEKQMKPVSSLKEMNAGDVFIIGGFPGHAVIIVDVAINEEGKKLYMLVQGYQPAQDIHLLVNPTNTTLSPWYEIMDSELIITPEWNFSSNQLRRW